MPTPTSDRSRRRLRDLASLTLVCTAYVLAVACKVTTKAGGACDPETTRPLGRACLLAAISIAALALPTARISALPRTLPAQRLSRRRRRICRRSVHGQAEERPRWRHNSRDAPTRTTNALRGERRRCACQSGLAEELTEILVNLR